MRKEFVSGGSRGRSVDRQHAKRIGSAALGCAARAAFDSDPIEFARLDSIRLGLFARLAESGGLLPGRDARGRPSATWFLAPPAEPRWRTSLLPKPHPYPLPSARRSKPPHPPA